MSLYPFELNACEHVCAEFYQTMTPSLRHDMIREWNWDFCPNFLHWVVAQDDCELATASLIFWSSCPENYEMYNENLWPCASDEYFFTVREVLERARKSLYTHQTIGYEIDSFLLTEFKSALFESDNEEYWELPETLKRDVEGSDVPKGLYFSTYLNMKGVPEHLAPRLQEMDFYLFSYQKEEEQVNDAEGRA